MATNIQGLWSLVSMKQQYDDGRVVFPFGEDAQGRIYYGEDGHMFVSIQKSGRTPFKTGKQWTASNEEKAGAYNDYLTYYGQYEVAGDLVTHAIEISLFPDWIGGRQKRKIDFDGELLQLSARLEDGTPEARSALMIWKSLSGNKGE